jgi:uncharacterized protein (DUF1501 family)
MDCDDVKLYMDEAPGGFGRREFLRAAAAFVALTPTVPAFLSQTVQAAKRGGGRKFSADERILVVLQLAGGNDGLNTVVPVTNGLYYKVRPKLAVPRDKTLKLDDDFALHGAAEGLKKLHDAGLLAVVHGVGYPNPNRSHFRSMDIWHTAAPDGRRYEGWLGRYFDNSCRGADGCSAEAAIALMEEAPLALRGQRFLPLAFEKPDKLGWMAATDMPATGKVVAGLNQPRPVDAPQPQTPLQYLRRVGLTARMSAERIQWATQHGRAGWEFPKSEVGRNLEIVAKLIAAGLPTRVYYVSHGGYDTHANQANRHERLLRELGEALYAFLAAMKAQGNLDRVLLLSFSEFGRRVAENGSQGTDHGAAAATFLAGGRVTAGLHGTPPDLASLDDGDLRHTTDFRSLYATVLGDWLGINPTALLGGEFARLPLLRRR